MTLSLHDTIVALATPPGSGARAIVRLSGPRAFALLRAVHLDTPERPTARLLHPFAEPLPGDAYLWPAPRTYTGQDLAELHLLGCGPLVEMLLGDLVAAGGRPAEPGEFTLRAFLAGKLDLTRAEAVLGVIEAGNRSQLRQALGQLAGNLARPLQALREDLLNLLADVEAGLDFIEEDITFQSPDQMLHRLASALAQLTLVQRQLSQRAVHDRTFRVVLAGRPNAGKSALFNALTGASALVSDIPGTTRDYLERRIDLGRVSVELVDTAGWQAGTDEIEEQAQRLAREQAERADLILLCLPAGEPLRADERALLDRTAHPPVLAVTTKADLAEPIPDRLAVSVTTGQGLSELRRQILERAGHADEAPLVPSLSRCQGHVSRCLEHLRRAHALVMEQDPPELLALELREALGELGRLTGVVYTDDLLDRIFSRFCIGK
jgi:tRNA modification GTPase